jgi:hypothetical protein
VFHNPFEGLRPTTKLYLLKVPLFSNSATGGPRLYLTHGPLGATPDPNCSTTCYNNVTLRYIPKKTENIGSFKTCTYKLIAAFFIRAKR